MPLTSGTAKFGRFHCDRESARTSRYCCAQVLFHFRRLNYHKSMNTEEEIRLLQERNRRVEGDKAWEVSWTRRLYIMALTYVVALVWLLLIKEPLAGLKAVVPVAGYLLSTLSLPVLKKGWLQRRH